MTGRIIGAGLFAAWGSGTFLVAASLAGPLSPLVVLIGLTLPASVAAGWLLLVNHFAPRPLERRQHVPTATRPALESKGAR